VRRKNFIRADEFPWDVGTQSAQDVPVVYDSGDYLAGLDRALELSNYSTWRKAQAAERARGDSGRWLGIGLGAYTMLTGLGPHESTLLRVDPSGKVALVTGSSPHGQGTATALAQIVGDVLGIAPDRISVAHGRYRHHSLRSGHLCQSQRRDGWQLGVRRGPAGARQSDGARSAQA